MRAAGAWLCLSVLCLAWWLVVWGGALEAAYEWVRRCPVCGRTIRKADPTDAFNCGNCGWLGR